MSDQGETRSEVARLLAQIQAEYNSGIHGLSGFASGHTRHAFITARMERMGQFHQELCHLVGEDDATALVVHSLEDQPGSTKNREY